MEDDTLLTCANNVINGIQHARVEHSMDDQPCLGVERLVARRVRLDRATGHTFLSVLDSAHARLEGVIDLVGYNRIPQGAAVGHSALQLSGVLYAVHLQVVFGDDLAIATLTLESLIPHLPRWRLLLLFRHGRNGLAHLVIVSQLLLLCSLLLLS